MEEKEKGWKGRKKLGEESSLKEKWGNCWMYRKWER